MIGIGIGVMAMPAWMSGFPELWVQPPTTTEGGAGFCDIVGSQITINRNATTAGSFTSDASLSLGLDYRLTFNFPMTGGLNDPWYAIDIRYVADGTDVIPQDLAPTSGAKAYNFTATTAGKILFTLPSDGWSARYDSISLKRR